MENTYVNSSKISGIGCTYVNLVNIRSLFTGNQFCRTSYIFKISY